MRISPAKPDETDRIVAAERTVVAPSFPAANEPAPEAQPVVSVSPDLLNFIGQQSEEVRASCDAIIRKVEETAALGRDLSTMFAQFDKIRTEFEKTQLELMQNSTQLSSERQAHLLTQTSARNIADQLERRNSELVSVQIENAHLNQTVLGLTADLDSVRHELSEEIKVSPLLRQELAAERTRVATLNRSNEALAEEVRRTDGTLSTLQSDLAAARDRIAVFEQDKKSLEAAIDEQRQLNGKLSRQLEDANAEREQFKERIKTLEASLPAERAEHDRIRTQLKDETDARRVEVSALTGRLDGLLSRLDATEKLLGDARQQLQMKSDNLRHEERRVQESALAANALEIRLQAADAKIAEFRDRVLNLEKSNTALIERTQTLVKAFKAKELEAEKSNQRLEAISARLAADTAKYELDRGRLESKNSELMQQLEKVRGEKSLLEGALAAARSSHRAPSQPLAPAPSRNDNAAHEEPTLGPRAPVDRAAADAPKPVRQASGLI